MESLNKGAAHRKSTKRGHAAEKEASSPMRGPKHAQSIKINKNKREQLTLEHSCRPSKQLSAKQIPRRSYSGMCGLRSLYDWKWPKPSEQIFIIGEVQIEKVYT